MTVMKLGVQFKLSYDALVSYIALCMMMDAYSSDMHCEHSLRTDPLSVLEIDIDLLDFNSTTIFQTLYKSFCLDALQMSYDSEVFVEFQGRCIEDHVKLMFFTLIQYSMGSAQLHRDNFKDKHLLWVQLKTNITCLFCLRRKPKHVLSCGHAICDTCVCIFGQAVPDLKYHYHISSCVLCLSGSLTTRLKPPTAGYRILLVDGGGT